VARASDFLHCDPVRRGSTCNLPEPLERQPSWSPGGMPLICGTQQRVGIIPPWFGRSLAPGDYAAAAAVQRISCAQPLSAATIVFHKPIRAADTVQPSIEVQGLRQLTVEDGGGLATRVSGRMDTSETSVGRKATAEGTAHSDSGLSCPLAPHKRHCAAIIPCGRVSMGGNAGHVRQSYTGNQYQMPCVILLAPLCGTNLLDLTVWGLMQPNPHPSD